MSGNSHRPVAVLAYPSLTALSACTLWLAFFQ
jgi:hypothetical protein